MSYEYQYVLIFAINYPMRNSRQNTLFGKVSRKRKKRHPYVLIPEALRTVAELSTASEFMRCDLI